MSDERKPDFESEGVHEVDLSDIPTDLGLLPLRDTLLFPQAILRLEAGTYGRCQECDVEIPPARLRALPFAALCRDCQEEAESLVRAEREAKAFERLQRELVNVTLRAGARD